MPDFAARIADLRAEKARLKATYPEIAEDAINEESGEPYTVVYLRQVMTGARSTTRDLTPVLDAVERALAAIRTRRTSVAA